MKPDILIYLIALIAINIVITINVIHRLVKIKRLIANQMNTNEDIQLSQKYIKEPLNNQNNKNRQNYSLNERDKNIIIDEVYNCIRLNEEEKLKKPLIINQQQLEKEQKVSNVKFPPSITKSGFPDDLSDKQGDGYFRFLNIEGDKANFDFCGTDIQRALANKVEIEQACEIVSQGSDPSKVENLEKGTVTLRDGKWEVTTKAKINFK